MDSTPPRSAEAKRDRSRLCAARGLPGSPIHGLAHLTDQLHFIAGETDGHFRIRSFNTREKSAISVFRHRLVCFIDRPGSEIGRHPLRYSFVFLCPYLHTASVCIGAFGTSTCDGHQAVSPTGIED